MARPKKSLDDLLGTGGASFSGKMERGLDSIFGTTVPAEAAGTDFRDSIPSYTRFDPAEAEDRGRSAGTAADEGAWMHEIAPPTPLAVGNASRAYRGEPLFSDEQLRQVGRIAAEGGDVVSWLRNQPWYAELREAGYTVQEADNLVSRQLMSPEQDIIGHAKGRGGENAEGVSIPGGSLIRRERHPDDVNQNPDTFYDAVVAPSVSRYREEAQDRYERRIGKEASDPWSRMQESPKAMYGAPGMAAEVVVEQWQKRAARQRAEKGPERVIRDILDGIDPVAVQDYVAKHLGEDREFAAYMEDLKKQAGIGSGETEPADSDVDALVSRMSPEQREAYTRQVAEVQQQLADAAGRASVRIANDLYAGITNRLIDRFATEEMPKGTLEALLRTAYRSSLIGMLSEADIEQMSGGSGLNRQVYDRAMEMYDPSLLTRIGGNALGLLADTPLFSAGGFLGRVGAGGLQKIAEKVVARQLLRRGASEGARAVAGRVVAKNLGLRLGQSAVASAATLGTYDAAAAVLDPLTGGETPTFSEVLKAAGRGAAMGALIGPLGVGTRVLSDRAASTVGKWATEAGGFAAENAAFVGMGTLFRGLETGQWGTAEELAEDFGHSVGVLSIMKAAGRLRRARERKPAFYDKVLAETEFTPEETEALSRAGVDGPSYKRAIFDLLDSKDTNAAGGTSERAAAERVRERYDEVLRSDEVPISAKVKLMYLVEGRLPERLPLVTDAERYADDAGRTVVDLRDPAGNLVQRRFFGSEADAEAFERESAALRNANRVHYYENALEEMQAQRAVEEAARAVAEERGMSADGLVDEVFRSRRGESHDEKSVEAVVERARDIRREEGDIARMIGEGIEIEYGMNEGELFDALRLRDADRTPRQREAVDAYASQLQTFVRQSRGESEPAPAESAAGMLPETATPEQAQTERIVGEAGRRIAEETNIADGVLYAATTKDNEVVRIINGNVAFDPETGEVDYAASDATVIVGFSDGSRRQLSIRDIDSIDEAIPAGEAVGMVREAVGAMTDASAADIPELSAVVLADGTRGIVEERGEDGRYRVVALDAGGAVVTREVDVSEIVETGDPAGIPDGPESGVAVSDPRIGRSLSDEEAEEVVAQMEERAVPVPQLELTPENWDAEFGEDGMVETPIGAVKMGENQYLKMLKNDRGRQFGMIKPTLTDPNIVVEDESKAAAGAAERPSSYIFVKTFLKPDGQKVRYYTSVTVSRDGLEVEISNHLKERNRINGLLKSGKLLYRNDGVPQSEQGRLPASATTPLTDTADVENKDTTSVADPQAAALEIPRLKNGAPDYNAMPAEMLAVELSGALGHDRAIERLVVSRDAKAKEAEKVRRSLETTGDLNKAMAAEERLAAMEAEEARLKSALSQLGYEEPEAKSGEPSARNFAEEIERLFPDGLPNVRARVLADIAGGQRFVWSDSPDGTKRGMAAELGFVGNESERRARFGMLGSEKGGAKHVSRYVHDLWEDSNGYGLEMDDAALRDEVIDVLLTTPSRASAMEQLRDMAARAAEDPNAPRDAEDLAAMRAWEADRQALREAEKSSTFAGNHNDTAYGRAEAARRDHDEPARASGNDGGRLAGDAAGAASGAGDRSDIRVFEAGISPSLRKYSYDSERDRREAESRRLVAVARDNGLYVPEDRLPQLGDIQNERTGESVVYIDRERGKVYKSKNPYAKAAMKGNAPEDAIFEHLVHNRLFPETAYALEGISDHLGDVRIVLSQDYVVSFGRPSQQRIETALAARGLFREDGYHYGNDLVSVTDVDGDNALLGEDGKVYFIDPIIKLNRPVREVLDELERRSAADADDVPFSIADARSGAPEGVDAERYEAIVDQLRRAVGADHVVTDPAAVRAKYAEIVARDETERARQVEAVNVRFNEQLERLTPENADSTILDVGAPSPVMLAVGMPDRPLRLYGNKLLVKAAKHGYDPIDLRNLPEAMEQPVALFKGRYDGAFAVLTELRIGADNVLATVDVNKGSELNVNILTSVYGKGRDRIARWIEAGKMLYADKKKVLDYLIPPAPMAGDPDNAGLSSEKIVDRTGLSAPIADAALNRRSSAAKVVTNFENPKIGPEEMRRSIVYHGSAADFERFDHFHMGEGEGAQAYGWGTYVTEVAGIARSYAEKFSPDLRSMEYDLNVAEDNLRRAKEDYEFDMQQVAAAERWVHDLQLEADVFHAEATRLKERYGESSPEYRNHIFYDDYANQLRAAEMRLKSAQDAVVFRKERIEKYENVVSEMRATIAAFKPNRNIYTVDIPDDTGLNYIEWTGFVDGETVERIKRAVAGAVETREGHLDEMEREKLDYWFQSVDTGEDLYNAVSIYLGAEGASKLLSREGFVGIAYPAQLRSGGRADNAYNYVIFDERDAQIVGHERYFRTKQGEVYGFTVDGTIYLDGERMNAEAPMHEYTELWSQIVERENPRWWGRAKEIMQNDSGRLGEIWNEVNEDRNYRDLSEDLRASETLSRASAEWFARQQAGIKENEGLFAALRRVVREFWRKLKSALTEMWGDDALRRMRSDDVIGAPVKDFTDGIDLRKYRKDRADAHKWAQMDIINRHNPMTDDVHAGIRTVDDIMSFDQIVEEARKEGADIYPDMNMDLFDDAVRTGKITVYSSYPIRQGVFVSPSRMNAEDYAGGGKVYSKTVAVDDVAWIAPDQGQYAKTPGRMWVDRRGIDAIDVERARIVERAKADGSWMKAPNGKPTKLTERQWADVRTEAFKEWFGDWENDPAYASRVVDENGEPRVVYHGTPYLWQIDKFDTSKGASWFAADPAYADRYRGHGWKSIVSRRYGVYLNIKHPCCVGHTDRAVWEGGIGKLSDATGIDASTLTEIAESVAEKSGVKVDYVPMWKVVNKPEFADALREYGYDGIMANEISGSSSSETGKDIEYYGGYATFAVLESNQVKSATNNLGSFSAENNDIRFMRDPFVERRVTTLERLENRRTELLADRENIANFEERLRAADDAIAEYEATDHVAATLAEGAGSDAHLRAVEDAVYDTVREFNIDSRVEVVRDIADFVKACVRAGVSPEYLADFENRRCPTAIQIGRSIIMRASGIKSRVSAEAELLHERAHVLTQEILLTSAEDAEAMFEAAEQAGAEYMNGILTTRDESYRVDPTDEVSMIDGVNEMISRTVDELYRAGILNDYFNGADISSESVEKYLEDRNIPQMLRRLIVENIENIKADKDGRERTRKAAGAGEGISSDHSVRMGIGDLSRDTFGIRRDTAIDEDGASDGKRGFRKSGSAERRETIVQSYVPENTRRDESAGDSVRRADERRIGADHGQGDLLDDRAGTGGDVSERGGERRGGPEEGGRSVRTLTPPRFSFASEDIEPKRSKQELLIDRLRQAVRDERNDVRTVVKLVGRRIREQFGRELVEAMGKRDFDNIVRRIEEATVRRDAEEPLRRIAETVLDMKIRRNRDAVEKLLDLRVQGTSPRGVSIAANVDDRTREFFEIIRNNRTRPAGEVLAMLEEKGGSLDARMGASLLDNYQAAQRYDADIADIAKEIDSLRSRNTALRRERAADNRAGRTAAAEAKTEEINRNKETIGALEEERVRTKELQLLQMSIVAGDLSDAAGRGREIHREWLKEREEHKRQIARWAFRDIGTGRDIPILDRQPGVWERGWDKVKDFFLEPAYSLNYLLKMVSVNAPKGEGELYDHFMRGKYGYVEARAQNYLGYESFKAQLDAKAREIFGKGYKEILAESARPTEATITIVGKAPDREAGTQPDTERKTVSEQFVPTIGEALYICMVDRMDDGRVKLRRMGIDGARVEALRRIVPEPYLRLADWIQEEFLPARRRAYNETHLEVFGTQMAEIGHYVPLKIQKSNVYQEVDGTKTDVADLPSAITGSIIRRRRNTATLDLHTNALDLMLEHGQQMEHWNAFTRVVQDMNALLSNTALRRMLNDRNPGLHKKLKVAAQIAADSYRPEINATNRAWVALGKLAASSKIAFRVNTALKQVLSYPAFYAYSADPKFWRMLTKNLSPARWSENFRWCLDNIPSFRERWSGRMAGNEKLAQLSAPQIDRWISKMGEWGMFPNALVDALTCANGAKAVYDYRAADYRRKGYDDAEAERRARIDAALSINETQQSGEGMFLSRVQVERDLWSVSISTFQNSNFAYLRKQLEGIDELRRDAERERRKRAEHYRERGLSDRDADRDALRDVVAAKREAVGNILTFMFVMNVLWGIGNKVWKYLFAEDGTDTMGAEMLQSALVSTVRNTAPGSIVESVVAGHEPNPSVLLSDLAGFVDRIQSIVDEEEPKTWDRTAVYIALQMLSANGAGVDLNTFVTMYEGVAGMIRDGADVEDVMLLLNAPRSQARLIASEPKPGESLEEYQRRVGYIERKIRANVDGKQPGKWARNYAACRKAEALGLKTARDAQGRVRVPELESLDAEYDAVLKEAGLSRSGNERADAGALTEAQQRKFERGLVENVVKIHDLERQADAMAVFDEVYAERQREIVRLKREVMEDWKKQ